MEEIASRFPILSKKIFNSLDNQSIAKCRLVSRFWQAHLDQQKYIQIRIIKVKVGDFHKIGDAWNRIFKEGSTEIIIDLGIAVTKFYKKGITLKYYEGLTPMHVAAAAGNLQLLRSIQEKTEDKNPEDSKGLKAIHYAAEYGQMEIVEFIGETYNDKNPGNNDGRTPFHAAALNGHLDV